MFKRDGSALTSGNSPLIQEQSTTKKQRQKKKAKVRTIAEGNGRYKADTAQAEQQTR